MTRKLLPQDLPQMEALGLRMRDARERREISAELMAERIGVPLETLQGLEDGSAEISLSDFYRALRILGLARDINKLAVDAEMVGKLLSIKEHSAYSADDEPSRPTLEDLLKERMRNANIGPNSR